MILPDFKAFPRKGRIIGIDWGMRRIGVAVSDPSREFVFVRDPICVARGSGVAGAEMVARMAKEEQVVGIIVGLPVRNDGTQSETTKKVYAFIEDLLKMTDLPICVVEENLTSNEAQEALGRVRVAELKARLDSEAARVILENAIAIINRT